MESNQDNRAGPKFRFGNHVIITGPYAESFYAGQTGRVSGIHRENKGKGRAFYDVVLDIKLLSDPITLNWVPENDIVEQTEKINQSWEGFL